MKKKIMLVTGGLGHIGSKLIRESAKRGDVELVRILDNLATQRYCSLFNLPENIRYEFIEGNIFDNEQLKKALEDSNVVIHLAAITDAPSTINIPEETFRINLEGTKKVLEAAFEAGVKTFLFPSTTSVYGEAEGIVDEDFKDYKPSSPYATSKFQAEKAVSAFGKRHSFDAKVLRFGTIFGISPGMRFHTAINKFCYQAALNIPLTVWENAYDQKRPYLGIDDAIRAFIFFETNGNSGELYNVLTANYSVREVVEIIKIRIPDLKINFTKSPILNQKSYTVSNLKAANVGFVPQDKIEEHIFSTIDLFKSIKN